MFEQWIQPPLWGNKARAVIVLWVALIFTLTGCGIPNPEPLIPGEPVWQDGELAIYQVTNRENRRIGDTYYRVDAGGPDEAAWTFTREINDIDVQEVVTVAVRSPGYQPLVSRTVRADQAGRQVIAAQHGRGQVDIDLTNRQGTTIGERVNPPSDVRDERTLLHLIRTLPLAQGYATAINGFLPTTGQTTRYIVWVARSERITVPAGSFDTWQVNMRTPANVRSQLWVSQTAPFPVVRYRDGNSQATFELASFTEGGQ